MKTPYAQFFASKGGFGVLAFANGFSGAVEYSLIASVPPDNSAVSPNQAFERITCNHAKGPTDCGSFRGPRPPINAEGAQQGTLILDSTNAYTVAYLPRVNFLTGTGAATSMNTITVGDKEYQSAETD
ncbi:MAG: hypothetical protein ACLQU2_32885 [Candidatus Binataceae bacterium]